MPKADIKNSLGQNSHRNIKVEWSFRASLKSKIQSS